MQNVQLLIHGQSVDASNQATFERISPIDGTVATKAAAATLKMLIVPSIRHNKLSKYGRNSRLPNAVYVY